MRFENSRKIASNDIPYVTIGLFSSSRIYTNSYQKHGTKVSCHLKVHFTRTRASGCACGGARSGILSSYNHTRIHNDCDRSFPIIIITRLESNRNHVNGTSEWYVYEVVRVPCLSPSFWCLPPLYLVLLLGNFPKPPLTLPPLPTKNYCWKNHSLPSNHDISPSTLIMNLCVTEAFFLKIWYS